MCCGQACRAGCRDCGHVVERRGWLSPTDRPATNGDNSTGRFWILSEARSRTAHSVLKVARLFVVVFVKSRLAGGYRAVGMQPLARYTDGVFQAQLRLCAEIYQFVSSSEKELSNSCNVHEC